MSYTNLMESAPEQPRKGGEIIPFPTKESVDAELKRLEQAVAVAFKELMDANNKDAPAAAELFDIAAELNRAKTDEERRERTIQLDAARQRRNEVWDEIGKARKSYAEAKAAYEAAKEELETKPVKRRKAA